MASIVSPIAQPSGPKSVSRPKRWSEEVEEGIRYFLFFCEPHNIYHKMANYHKIVFLYDF